MAEQLRIAASNDGNVIKLGDEPRQRPIFWTRDRVERDTAQLLRRRQLIEELAVLVRAAEIQFPRLVAATEAAEREKLANLSRVTEQRWVAALNARQTFTIQYDLDKAKILRGLSEGVSPRLAEMKESLMDEIAALTGRYSRPGVPKPRNNPSVSERSSERTIEDIVHGRTVLSVREKTNHWSIGARLNAIKLAWREVEDLALEADQSDDALRPKLERLWAGLPAVSSELRYREQRP